MHITTFIPTHTHTHTHTRTPQPFLNVSLKLQYFGHLMRRTDLLEKTLMLGKIEGNARVGCFERTASKHVYYLG